MTSIPTRTRIRPRAAVTALVPLLAGALTLTAVIAPAQADPTDSGQSYGADTYIVKLSEAPVAAYEGGLPRLKRTAPVQGGRLDADSKAVDAYLRHLDTRRDKVLDAVPGVRPLYDYAYTFNGFAAELTAKQAAKLAVTPGVVSLTRNTVAQLTSDAAPGEDRAASRTGVSFTSTSTSTSTSSSSSSTSTSVEPEPAPAPAPAPEPNPAPGPEPVPDHGPGAAPSARTDRAPQATEIPSATSSDKKLGEKAADESAAGEKAGKAGGSAAFPDIAGVLGLSGDKGLWAKAGGPKHAGEGMIVGIVDTGVSPSNPMLKALPEPLPDAEVIAKKWHGKCDPGTDAKHKITCNNKVIGAQWFGKGMPQGNPEDVTSPMDTDSHGTHTGTTAAGNHGVKASVPGSNASGKLSGLAPAARLAYYKACWSEGCPMVDTTAAIDQAVADGVDVINYSIGGAIPDQPDMEAMFNAAKAGVFIATSANNDGPDTVEHTEPWVTTVAAASHDTKYTASLVLGDGRGHTNLSLNPGVASAPLVLAADVRKAKAKAKQATLCAPGTLDPKKAKGKIVVCDRGGDGIWVETKTDEVKAVGGKAMVLTHTATSAQDFFADVLAVPMIQIGPKDAKAVRKYAAGAGATAKLTPTKSSHRTDREITDFSSSGPDHYSDGDLLKPDIASFGENIPAGVVPGGTGGYTGSFGFADGTSMSSPHIAGLATLLKQLHPDWSPMEIKSALMTTATTTDEKGRPIGRKLADSASPLDYGAGLARMTHAADPGLVYDSTSADWTAYVCSLGLTPPASAGTDACASAAKLDPSDLNYPSISVGDLLGHQTVKRTVTNVSAKTATYDAKLQTPPGFRAKVTPKRFTVAAGESATYKVRFERTNAAYDKWSFGSLKWTDTNSRHQVTSPIALRPTVFAEPKEVTVTGTDSATLTPGAGYDGELTARAELYTGVKATGTLTGTDQSDFWESQHENEAVVKSRVHVPKGSGFTRLAVREADHLPGSDIDLYVFDTAGNHIGAWPGVGSDEHVDLPPGDYDVYVLQYELPAGTAGQQYTLWTWKVGQGDPTVTATVTPATQKVTAGDRPKVTVSWPTATKGERYVGFTEFGDGSRTLGRTTLTVTP
ncbi:hypothetical protein SGFS_061040 [Streptomyces graminofaciens]|uniref:Uncharacterized protein n=1 Tax=Streptomyces graminofaciens TaxID=68212 RepID=A0ABN5VMY2_9ACTN|nr:S8 family serine peptidase [Streptomyces graminofaciens]BBC34810.1 hypothetical protein SGFS_061040 [Streptomyces graminofaciens]